MVVRMASEYGQMCQVRVNAVLARLCTEELFSRENYLSVGSTAGMNRSVTFHSSSFESF